MEERGKNFYVLILVSESKKVDMNILNSHCVLTQSNDNVKLIVLLLTTLKNRNPTIFASTSFKKIEAKEAKGNRPGPYPNETGVSQHEPKKSFSQALPFLGPRAGP